MSRYRSRSQLSPGGTALWMGAGNISPATSSWTTAEECSDVVGQFDQVNPFYLERTCNLAWVLTGRSRPTGSRWEYNGYVKTSTAGGHIGAGTSEPSDNETLSEALARTNPNRSIVDVPIFLNELREIPKLVHHFSQLGLKKFKDKPLRELGSNYLTWEYGVKPFTSDLFRMMDFTNLVEQRVREFRNLQSGKAGLGRKWTVWKDKKDFPPWVTYASALYNEGNMVSATWSTERKKWASTRWIPNIDLSTLTDDQLRNRANRAVFGYDVSFATLWEAMPWSWLIDWYSNIGDIVSLSRNTIPVHHGGSCVMRRTVTRVTSVTPVSGPGLHYFGVSSKGFATRTELIRLPWSFGPLPEFNLPFLNGRQLSILSAISVTRRR